MINRNADDHFAKTPTPHYPRSRFDMGTHKRLQTQGHGRLYPFYCRMVYPGDTWQMDASVFARMDTSYRVPLDDIYLDTYWFFVPLRIIDKNFPKILGEGEPSDYDDVSYGFPQLPIDGTTDATWFGSGHEDNLLPYLGYSQCVDIGFLHDDHICPYPLAAFYKIYNDWFRDENVDSSIPYEDLYDTTLTALDDLIGGVPIWNNLQALPVNRFHDYFSSAVILPQKGPAVTIPLGSVAPVGVSLGSSFSLSSPNGPSILPGTYSSGFGPLKSSAISSTIPSQPIVADLSQAAGTINELRLAFAIQSLYEKRGRYGTRFIEVIRGQWGLEVPDSFFLRPEYLGGNRVTLNNVPVLSTENSSQLGQMSGNSATLSNCGSWSKSFCEYGLILGLSCTRIKHSYTQGKRKEIFSLKTQLDLYNPVFANIGMQPIWQNEIYNKGDAAIGGNEGVVFGYQEAWAELRSDMDSFAGLFGVFSGSSVLQNYWHYGDYYQTAPVFSSSWLKEDQNNVSKTLTGQLIPDAGATNKLSHQFMFAYYYHPVVTRILPSYSIPVELTGRL